MHSELSLRTLINKLYKLYILVPSFGVKDNAIAQSVKICTVIVISALVMYTTKAIHYTSASVNTLG